MKKEIPESMEECVYFTRRKLGENGQAIAWVLRKECSQCKKGKMGKPVEKGKIKVRSTEYVCPECGYTEQKKDHEEKLEVEINYTCPDCAHEGHVTTPYKRKKWQGVDAFVFSCEDCGIKLGVTKKMKQPKKKG